MAVGQPGYARALLYLAARAPAKAKLRSLAGRQDVRFAAFIWNKRAIDVATDVIEYERRAISGEKQKFVRAPEDAE